MGCSTLQYLGGNYSSSLPPLPMPVLLPPPTPSVFVHVLSVRMACRRRTRRHAIGNRSRAAAATAISWLVTTSWSCCINRTTPMGAMISPPFQRHCRHPWQRGVGGDHCNFHSTSSLPAEDGIADCGMMGWTNVVMPSAGKEVVVTTLGPSAPAGKTLWIRMGPGGAGGSRPQTPS